MDFTLIVFIGFALFFTYKGYRQGLLVSIARVASFVAGYAASIFFGSSVAAWLEKMTAIEGLLAYIIGGVGVFVLASFLVALIFSAIAKKIQKKRGEKISTVSSMLGAITGLAIGSGIALFMVFFISFAQDLVQEKNNTQRVSENNGVQNDSTKNKAKPKNIVEKISNSIAGKIVNVVSESSDLDPASAKIAAAMVTDPGKVLTNFQHVVNSPATRALFNDPENQNALNNNDVEAIINLPAFKNMVNDSSVQELAALSGMNAEDSAVLEKELAEKIGSMWSKAQAVKNDTRMQEILKDPEFQQALKNNNPIALIANPKFMEILEIITTENTE